MTRIHVRYLLHSVINVIANQQHWLPFIELKVKLKAKPYDAKKSCWVPNKATHGYDEGLIESTEGDKVTVQILETGDVSTPLDGSGFISRYENCA